MFATPRPAPVPGARPVALGSNRALSRLTVDASSRTGYPRNRAHFAVWPAGELLAVAYSLTRRLTSQKASWCAILS